LDYFKYLKVLGFRLLVGDVVSEVGSDVFGQGHRTLGPTPRTNISLKFK